MSSEPLQEPSERVEEKHAVSDFSVEGTEKLDRYGHTSAWARETGISQYTIQIKLRGSPWICGIDEYGTQRKFFAETEVRAKLGNLFEYRSLPLADDSGFLEVGEKRFAHRHALIKELKIYNPTINMFLDDAEKVQGKDRQGKIRTFYSVEEVRKKIEKERQSWANAEGVLVRAGKRCAHRRGLHRELGIPRGSIDRLLMQVEIEEEKVEGTDMAGKSRTFYLIEGVQRKANEWKASKKRKI